jgi:exonuclease VII large subunit
MSGAIDMSTPVTRGELREELEQLRQTLRQDLRQELGHEFRQALQLEVSKLATKHELEMWGGALLARIETGERRLVKELNRLNERIGSTEQRLNERMRVELARHSKANHESMVTLISAIDDKYKDLPGRMKRLETMMRPPRRR